MFDQFEIETCLGTRAYTNRQVPERYYHSFTSNVVDNISKHTIFDDKPPNVQHVYVSSLQKRSEIIKTQSGYTFVHDIYATTVFSFVNRFVVKPPSTPALTSFIRTQQALRLTNLGFFDEAELLLRASALDGHGLMKYLQRVQTHKNLAALQDIFLILHEQTHLFFALSEQCRSAFQEWREFVLSPAIIASLKQSARGHEDVVTSLNDPDVQEEAFCDSQAINVMADLWATQFAPAGFLMKDFISAIPLFFVASRLIAVVENMVDEVISHELGQGDVHREELFHRKHNSIVIRGLLSAYEFQLLCKAGWCKRRFVMDAVSLADKASRISAGLMDEGLFGLPHLFNRKCNAWFREQGRSPRRYNPWESDFFSRREQILQLLKVDYDSVDAISLPPRHKSNH